MSQQTRQPNHSLFQIAVFVAALGYFVDIYDLLLFTIVREPSLKGVGVTDPEMMMASTSIINWQMFGLLLGGILWGVMGDKKGRLSVLFGSIILYSIGNFLNGYVQTVGQYAAARFVAGIGLAGELGAGITLGGELLHKKNRGIGTSLVAGFGLFGAVFAYGIYKLVGDWRVSYWIGAGLGVILLILRVSVAESGMFHAAKHSGVMRGNFLKFFTNPVRFRKYMLAILIGLPTWFIIGILVNLSNRFAKEMYTGSAIDSGRAIMFAYAGIATGGIVIGLVSQWYKSRKKAVFLFYTIALSGGILYFSPLNNSDLTMYLCCTLMGFGAGFWAMFVTMGAEQFGTNIRATAATTIPNMVRGALPLINMLFLDLFQKSWGWKLVNSGIVTGVIVVSIAYLSLWFTEETFHKDLDYFETLP